MNSHHYNFIIFRTDRLGDFIIHSRPIYELKFKYPNSHITVVCSSLNEKIISNYSFIDEVIIHNKYDSLFKKFNNFIQLLYLMEKNFHIYVIFLSTQKIN